ncbi:MAG TPA: hypothetical protein VHB79_26905 [Polyangiaceae bacterium]|nr:hypothetical protein [Polyangiaceae bacterium]
MTQISQIEPPQLTSFQLNVTAPNLIAMAGTIAISDPGLVLGGCFRQIHEAALADGVRELVVDVRQLTFVNSSAIRLFVDWSSWVAILGARGYLLRFRTDRRITWQRTSFAVLQSLGGKSIALDGE